MMSKMNESNAKNSISQGNKLDIADAEAGPPEEPGFQRWLLLLPV